MRTSKPLGWLLCLAAILAPGVGVGEIVVTGRGSLTRLESTTPVQVVSQEVISEINYARANPDAYADLLKKLPPSPSRDDAINYVADQKPMGPLTNDPRLADAAAKQALDQGTIGGVSHISSAGEGPLQRLQKSGVYAMIVAEEISVSQYTPRSIVSVLVVDAGVANSLHRKDIFDQKLTMGGAACAAHKSYKIICVVEMSGPEIVVRKPGG